jgi:hypothetical protein
MWIPSRILTVWRWRGLFRERLRTVQAAAEWIADEMDENARRLRSPGYSTTVGTQPAFLFDAWRDHGPTLHALAKPEPELWRDVQDVYSRMRAAGYDDAFATQLEDVAVRLRAKMAAQRF